MSQSLSILGSTGSVGVSTVDVVKSQGSDFSIHALTAHKNVSLLAKQAIELHATVAVIGDESLYSNLKEALSGTSITPAAGRSGLMEAASHPVDCAMAAIVGMTGLEPLLAALKNGKKVAIANKEPLVSAGTLVMEMAAKHGATILPVDSEHNAIFQTFDPKQKDKIRRLILTASGGPFREWSLEQMAEATPEQALAHPTWSMGTKISIDSATMMNKALEVIEAHFLFGMPASQIDVLIHPQSIVHSMVEYTDGSVLAQMGASDMRVPIAHALGWPNRLNAPAQHLDFNKLSALTFAPVDACRFPAIKYAYDCLMEGSSACIAFNAANEMAVAAFLAGRIKFLDIVEIVQKTVEGRGAETIDGLQSILAFDQKMRNAAQTCILETDNAHNPSHRKVS